MANLTSSTSDLSTNQYSSDLTTSYPDDQFDDKIDNHTLLKLTKPDRVEKICLQNQLERNEEISIVQSLRTQIEPNHNVSQTVSRAAARLEERIGQHVEIAEKMFKSIDDEIGRQIQSASQGLDELLIVIDNSLSSILESINSSDLMQFDLLRKSFADVDDLINKRNQNISNFVDVTRKLEKERTALIETCYRQHMFDIKQLSGESYEWLFEKYLKNYNAIKLGNFRMYEDLRFKLVLLSEKFHQDFVLRAYDVKLSIKMNIMKIFKDKFRTAAEMIMSDNISAIETKSIFILNDSNQLIDSLTCQVEKHINHATISESSESFKNHSKKIDEIVDSELSLLPDKVSEDIKSLSTNTIEELNGIIKESGESLSPDELTAIAEEMLNEVGGLLQCTTEAIIELQLLMSGVKEAVRAIHQVLDISINIIDGHLKRLTKVRTTILEALRTQFKSNDKKLTIFVDSFDATFDSLVQASTKTEVLMLEKDCHIQLKYIKKRIQKNRTSEMNIVSSYEDLVKSEFAKISEEVQTILSSFLDSLKSLPEYKKLLVFKFWGNFIETWITPFKATVENCQKTFYERLLTLISDLKSSDLLNNECTWTRFLTNGIEERCVDAAQLLELRSGKVFDGVAKKRMNEIEEHHNVLEFHIKAAREISEHLHRQTNALHEEFHRQKNVILKNVELIRTKIDKLSMLELSVKTNKLRSQIDLVANELNDHYKLHYETVESEHRAIENSTSKFINSIKLFPEGGNYGHVEATIAIDTLNDLKRSMLDKQMEIMNLSKRMSYGSISETKELLSKLIKPVEIELDKKTLKQKYYAINKLMSVTVNQEILNLEKTIDGLHRKLSHVEKMFEKDNVTELSKCWSALLMETQAFADYFFESYRDISALLKSQTKNSIWNFKSEKFKTTEDSTNTFLRGKSKFYDYCKSVFGSSAGTDDAGARFLNNIYLTMRQYVLESQNNAADMAQIESNNIWLAERSDIAQMYREIMGETLKKSRATILQVESIWILILSDFCDFLRDGLHGAERKFKNVVLATYHEESLARLALSFDSIGCETESTRRRLKVIRDGLRDRLKASHGHPDNARRLEALLDEFRLVRSECEDSLQDVCNRAKNSVLKFAENYETRCPKDVMRLTTISVKCHSDLRTRLNNVKTTVSISSVGNEYEAISKALVNRITEKHAVERATDNVKRYASETGAGIVFWPDNKRLWADNLQAFLKLCQDRFDDVQTFGAVEESKIVDWATMFVQDVERVKKLHH